MFFSFIRLFNYSPYCPVQCFSCTTCKIDFIWCCINKQVNVFPFLGKSYLSVRLFPPPSPPLLPYQWHKAEYIMLFLAEVVVCVLTDSNHLLGIFTADRYN